MFLPNPAFEFTVLREWDLSEFFLTHQTGKLAKNWQSESHQFLSNQA
jgi:hypothetical protein